MPGTGTLIKQFCDAATEWARESGQLRPGDIVAWTLVWTGAGDKYAGVGAVKTEGLSDQQRQKLTIGQLRGYHTVEQMRDWLTRITGNRGLDEEFVVLGLISNIELELEELSEGYSGGIARVREQLEFLEGIAADSGRKSDFFEAMNKQLARSGQGELYGDDDLIRMIERLRQWSQPSLVEQRDRRQRLDAWRQITGSITDRDNLKRYRGELFKSVMRQMGASDS